MKNKGKRNKPLLRSGESAVIDEREKWLKEKRGSCEVAE